MRAAHELSPQCVCGERSKRLVVPCAVVGRPPQHPQSHAAASALHPQLKQVTTTLRSRPTCIAAMVNYWSQLCTAQTNRPLPQLLQALYGSCIFAVSVVVRVCFARAACAADAPGTAGCFVRVCCCVQWDVVCAVGEALGSDAAGRFFRALR
jgi:hypothetical protein